MSLATAVGRTVYIVAALLWFSEPGSSQATGKELLDLCKAQKGTAQSDLCGTYLLGAMEMAFVINETLDMKAICPPEGGINADQLVQLVQKFLTANQTRLEERGAVLILDMLTTEYRCHT